MKVSLLFASLLSLPLHAAVIVNDPLPITSRVTIQVVMVADDDGLNAPPGFGTPEQQADIIASIDTVWAQAGIDTDFYFRPGTWNDTFALRGNAGSGSRPLSDSLTLRSMATSAGLLDPDPLVLNLFIVEICPGSFPFGSGTGGAGLGWEGENVMIAAFGTSALNTATNRARMAGLLAHEIGHNFGLEHVSTLENLMRQGVTGERLDAAQIQIALDSSFSVPIPEPSSIALILFATSLAWWRRGTN